MMQSCNLNTELF